MASIVQAGDKWRAFVRRRGYPLRSKTFESFTKAKAWATGIEAKMNDAEYRITGAATLRPLLERYREEVATKMRGSKQVVIRINRMLEVFPFLDRSFADDLSADIRKYRDKRLKQISYRGKPISGDTVRRELCELSSVIQYAKEEWGLKGVNPVREVKLPPKGKKRNRRPTEDELKRIYSTCKFDGITPPRNDRGHRTDKVGWLVALAIETAMRLGELCSIEVGDVHLAERYVHLRATKNGDERDVILTVRAVELLRVLMPETGLVFGTTAQMAGANWRYVRDKAGVSKDLRFHDLRHEAITRITNRVKNAAQACAFSGHRDPRSLMGYYNPTREELTQILDA